MHSNAPSPSTSNATRLRRQIARMKGAGRDTTDLERRVLELEYGDVASLEHGEPMQHTPGAIADVDADEPTPLNLSAMEAVNAQTTAQREDRALLLNGVMRDERDASIYSALRFLYGAAHVVVGVTMAYVSYRASTLLADGLINLLGGW